jgi:hypothetical protein
VGRVNGTLQNLRPVARQKNLGNADTNVGRGRPGRRLKFWNRVFRSHVGPDHATPFLCRISLMLHFICHAARGRLGSHFQDIALHIHLPAVVQAPKTAFFIATIHQRSPPVWAVLIHDTYFAVGVSKYDQVFAKSARFDGRAVSFSHFFKKTHWGPVSAHQPPHWGVPLNAAQQVVFFLRHHGNTPKKVITRLLLPRGCGFAGETPKALRSTPICKSRRPRPNRGVAHGEETTHPALVKTGVQLDGRRRERAISHRLQIAAPQHAHPCDTAERESPSCTSIRPLVGNDGSRARSLHLDTEPCFGQVLSVAHL